MSIQKLYWPFILFATFTFITAVAGSTYILLYRHIFWETILLAIVLYIIYGLSITAGYHRLFSHRSYTATWIIRVLFLFFGAGNFLDSTLAWCKDHRRHHQCTDTIDDPYNIKRGFFYAHMGWLFFKKHHANSHIHNISDLKRDPLIRLQHHIYFPLALISGFGLPTFIAWLWGDALGGFIFAGVIRVIITQHATFMVNSVAHYFGSQSHSTKVSACDNWFLSLITFGEGFHNYHHAYPYDYRNGIRYFHWDPTKWLIKFLQYIGLASNLRIAAIG
jgi:stearoyl-CoA desaturase (delta-9 desaturase)